MSPKNILTAFQSMFPTLAESTKMWCINNKNSIKIRFTDGHSLIFTYYSDTDWYLETYDHYNHRYLDTLED